MIREITGWSCRLLHAGIIGLTNISNGIHADRRIRVRSLSSFSVRSLCESLEARRVFCADGGRERRGGDDERSKRSLVHRDQWKYTSVYNAIDKQENKRILLAGCIIYSASTIGIFLLICEELIKIIVG